MCYKLTVLGADVLFAGLGEFPCWDVDFLMVAVLGRHTRSCTPIRSELNVRPQFLQGTRLELAA